MDKDDCKGGIKINGNASNKAEIFTERYASLQHSHHDSAHAQAVYILWAKR